MNKRSLFFIISLSLAFFFIQEYVFPPKPLPIGKPVSSIVETKKVLIHPDELPITTLYSSEDCQTPLFPSISLQNKYLTLCPSDEAAPSVCVVKADNTKEVAFLQTEETSLGAPIIYSEKKYEHEPLLVADNLGREDVQLISFSKDNLSITTSTAKPYQNNLEAPAQRSVILVPSPRGLLPYGILEVTGKIRALKSYPELKGLLHEIVIEEKDDFVGKEQFYVLENGSMQLVFSNIGGAISEINLPIKGDSHPNSPILPIEFDEELLKQYPVNDRFPLLPYLTVTKQGNVVAIEKGKEGSYYPLLRRDILAEKNNAHGPAFFPPNKYAFTVSSLDEEEPSIYKLTSFTNNSIQFVGTVGNTTITKTYTLDRKPDYCFNLSITTEGRAGRKLYLSTGIPEVELISGSAAPILKYRAAKGNKKTVEKISLPKEGKDATSFSSIVPDWICNSNGFFGVILDDLTQQTSAFTATAISGAQIPSRVTLIDSAHDLYPTKKFPGYELKAQLPQGAVNYRIFAGPFQTDVLKAADTAFTDKTTNYNPDYLSAQSYHGFFSFISAPLGKVLFVLMHFFFQITKSWGLSIILLTVAVRLMLYPLTSWASKSTIKMQQLAPEIKKLQERYKGDEKAKQLATMQLYKDKGVNPFGGCLPILIQMPVFIALFDLLKSSFELRGASFIPGWIPNLSAPDTLFSWSYPIPFVGTSFHLLPIVFCALMFLQQRISSTGPTDVSEMSDSQRQQKAMMNIMLLVFAVMFYNFPSGLNIYFICSTGLGILQQWWMMRQLKLKKG